MFENVLGYEIVSIHDKCRELVIIAKDTKYTDAEVYNKYELASRCISWCLGKGYEITAKRPIVSDDTGKSVINFWYIGYIFKFELGVYEDLLKQELSKDAISIISDNYAEAIFKCTEYVYNTKENNK